MLYLLAVNAASILLWIVIERHAAAARNFLFGRLINPRLALLLNMYMHWILPRRQVLHTKRQGCVVLNLLPDESGYPNVDKLNINMFGG
jgi:hypothetical protein